MLEKGKLVEIPLKDLVTCPLNPRTFFGDVESLARTIEETGQPIAPLLVRKVNDKYEVRKKKKSFDFFR